jgi:hypothetical protein
MYISIYLYIYSFPPQPSLMDSYDYCMHGRVFSIKHIENQCIEAQISFGGIYIYLYICLYIYLYIYLYIFM